MPYRESISGNRERGSTAGCIVSRKIYGSTGCVPRRYAASRSTSRRRRRSGPNGHSVVESRLTLDAVGAAMAYLPHDQRVLIALVCIDGLSYKEAAAVTQTPIGTVMSRLARARRELHARLEGHSQDAIPRPQTPKSGRGA